MAHAQMRSLQDCVELRCGVRVRQVAFSQLRAPEKQEQEVALHRQESCAAGANLLALLSDRMGISPPLALECTGWSNAGF